MNFVVVGAGAWGTAFALHLARCGHAVTLVPRRAEHAAALNATRENADYLPGMALPLSLTITADLEAALREEEFVLLACPAQALRETATRLRGAPVRARRKRGSHSGAALVRRGALRVARVGRVAHLRFIAAEFNRGA